MVEHVQRPFGIPALARDLYAGRPNHYDETAARWAQSQPVRAKQIREYDEDDYDDDDDYEDDDNATETDPARPGSPSGQPPSRGRKRAHSQVSSIDSTLSAELDLEPGEPQPSTTDEVRQDLSSHERLEPHPDTTEEVVQELLSHGRLARERVEMMEGPGALEMAAAANTLHGGGRGLIGAPGALCMANDVVIRRRIEELNKKRRREEERRAAEAVGKKGPKDGGGSGGVGGSGSGDAAPSGGVGRG